MRVLARFLWVFSREIGRSMRSCGGGLMLEHSLMRMPAMMVSWLSSVS